MEPEFNSDLLRARLDPLPRWKQIAFMLSCCERMFPDYVLFSRETGWGSSEVIRTALNEAWSVLEAGKISKDLSQLEKQCDEVTPDMDDFDSSYASAALDAAVGASVLMHVFSTFEVESVLEVATLAIDSVDLYIQDIEEIKEIGPNTEYKIQAHELMQKELTRQRSDIELLDSLSDDMMKSVPVIREKWFDNKTSYIGLTI